MKGAIMAVAKQMKQTNKSLIPWAEKVDISGKEEYRTYKFAEGEFIHEIIIKKPVFLIVSNNGHRLLDEEGISHYVPYGWIELSWKNVEGRSEGFQCLEKKKKKVVKK
jgi:hypothetical protein